jgi:hypothetical protein
MERLMTYSPQVTVFKKSGGPLTKRISLNPDGTIKSDGSACVMSRGRARRVELNSAQQLAELISTFGSSEAITLGALREDLPDEVEVATKRQVNGNPGPNVVARDQEHIQFQFGTPAFTLIDHDTKGMPTEVHTKMTELGGFWPTLLSVLPALRGVERVERRSTSAGLFNQETGVALAASDGMHVYPLLKDGRDGERFLKTLHERCWLKGLGWMIVGAGGQLLDRSIVDRMVGSPERLVFEGAPILEPPLAQDKESRRPVVIEGEALDAIAACPPLTNLEKAKLRELRAKKCLRLAPEAAKEKDAFINRQAKELAQGAGIDLHRARQTIKRQCEGVLLPDVVLPFDAPEFAGSTVGDVLTDPARFEGATLADPLEGVDYGRCKARVMRRADGSVWINSFAHGRTAYELKLDAHTARIALERVGKDEVVEAFVQSVLASDLTEDQIEELRNLVHDRSGINKRTLDSRLKGARKEEAARRARKEAERLIAERQDPRPQLPVPASDAEWLPTMQTVNEVLGSSCAAEPPMRNTNSSVVLVRGRHVLSLHLLTSNETNDDSVS